MPVISMGSINIPSAIAPLVKAESLKILTERQPLDDTLPSIPNTDPTTWSNKQLLQYHLVWGPSLIELLRAALVEGDTVVVAAMADSLIKVGIFDTARSNHNAASDTLKAARLTARDNAKATVTGFGLS